MSLREAVYARFGEVGVLMNNAATRVGGGVLGGITNPPGNLAYNVSKAALRTYTEDRSPIPKTAARTPQPGGLPHDGPSADRRWTTTGKRGHKPGAWLPDQVIDFMLAALDRGDFYIICPDDETTSEMERKRISGRPAIWSRTVLRRLAGIPTTPASSSGSARDLPAPAARLAGMSGFRPSS
jgi:hypothetical protein